MIIIIIMYKNMRMINMKKDLILFACMILVIGMFVQSGTGATGPNATNATAQAIVSETIDVTLIYTGIGIDFGQLAPNTQNNSANTTLNISIELTTNVRTNISMKAMSNFTSGADFIPINNLIYNNLSFDDHSADYNVSMALSYNSPFSDWINIPKPNVTVPQHRNSSFYLSIPDDQVGGTYTTNINVNVTRSRV